ncbi:MAG: hypothetical protein ABS903_17355 [Solibacillus sp.]
MDLSHWIGIGGILATVIVGILSWVISSIQTKKQLNRKIIGYEFETYKIVPEKILKNDHALKISYKDEELYDPVLLTVDIMNLGNVAIESPPIEIQIEEANYIFPGYLEDVPPGYEDMWSLEKIDNSSTLVKINHINPGQTLKARFFLKEPIINDPIFKCPMPNIELKKIETDKSEMIISASITGVSISKEIIKKIQTFI